MKAQTLHINILTLDGYNYNKKETKLKKRSQPNKVIIIVYSHKVQNEKYFLDL